MPDKTQLEILVVDDTAVSRALICNGLEQIGLLKVHIARDGEEALAAMMTRPVPLVISDLNMPRLDGLGLLRKLREHAPTRRIGFILVTGSDNEAILREASRWGLNNYLAKPFTPAGLRACIEAVTGKLT